MSQYVLFLYGLFNIVDPVFGLQVYIWGWIGIIIMAIACWFAWRYGTWEHYKPLWGLFHAFKAESFAAFVFNLSLYSELLSEAQAKCIFEYEKIEYEILGPLAGLRKMLFYYGSAHLPKLDPRTALLYKMGHRNIDVEIARNYQNNEWEESPSVTIGGIRTDIVLDADNWTLRKSPQHQAIESQCETHNEGNPSDQIHAYSKYQRYLLEGRLPTPPGVKKEVTIPWIRIDSAFPLDLEDNEMSGARRQTAADMEYNDRHAVNKYILPILIGSFALAALILVARFLS